MFKYIFIFFFIILNVNSKADYKEKIIKNLEKTQNLNFSFKQNINGKIENGNCVIQYPKKIFCKYTKNNNKTLVSNGKSLVIKTTTGYYRYPLKKTPLNLILDKNFLIENIKNLEEKIVEGNLISYSINEKDNLINIFFNNKTFDLVGWQNIDVYQNFNFTFLSSITKNKLITDDLFEIPSKH